jgi:deoxynucleoside triphosphate triphosphohydrolase SAMHD1
MMRFLEQRSQEPICAVASQVDVWAQDLLHDYLGKGGRKGPQEVIPIDDPICGRVLLHSWERFIVDSPMFQRLRHVRHLGLAHFAFPSANASYFEHAIGSLAYCNHFITALRHAPKNFHPESLASKTLENVIRLAALLRFVGYGPMGLLRVLRPVFPDFEMARKSLSDCFGTSVSAEDFLSVLLISSPSCRELLRRADIPLADDRFQAENLVESISAFICGVPPETHTDLFPCQIINSAVGVSRLDAVARTAHNLNLPVALHVSHLLSSIRLIPIDAVGGSFALGIEQRGQRFFEELVSSELTILTDIHLDHHCLVAQEMLVQALLRYQKRFPELVHPVSIAACTDERLLSFADYLPSVEESDEYVREYRFGEQLSTRVRNRDLPSRILGFTPRFLLEAPRMFAKIVSGTDGKPVYRDQHASIQMFESFADPQKRTEFATRATDLCRELGEDCGTAILVWPDYVEHLHGSEFAIIDADQRVQPSDLTARRSNQLLLDKSLGWVFADNVTPSAYLAFERQFAESGAEFSASARTIVGAVSETEVETARMQKPVLRTDINWVKHRHSRTFLREKVPSERIQRLEPIFAQFLAPHGITARAIIEAWLWQFPDPDLQDSALTILEHVRILNRRDRAGYLSALLARDGNTAAWCEFVPNNQLRPKSAEVLGYQIKDLGTGHPAIRRLSDYSVEQLRSIGRIAFLDDILCTGAQASTLLYSWFGKPSAGKSASDRDTPLQDEYRKLLLTLPIAFYFIVGWPEGMRELAQTCAELGIQAEIHCGAIAPAEGWCLSDVSFASPTSATRVKNFLKDKGEQLLAFRTLADADPWTPEDVAANSLGYGGLGGLIAFDYTIPTCFVTPLWLAELSRDRIWIPVLPRYSKPLADRIHQSSLP